MRTSRFRHSSAFFVLALIAFSSGMMSNATATSVWGNATPAVFPAGIQWSTPQNGFNAVSCATPGNCTAVGGFVGTSGSDISPFTMTSINGVWGVAVPAVFPAGIQYNPTEADFTAVSCASAGNCTAVGDFRNVTGHLEAFTMTSTNGMWGNAQPASFANGVQNTTPRARFTSVSCTSAGNCTAVGTFKNSRVIDSVEAFTMTSTNGTWSNAQPASFANGVQSTNQFGEFTSVSCTSAGNCTATGWFKNFGGDYEAFTTTSTNGTWGNAQPASFANGVQSTTPSAEFKAVSCTSAGNCTAVGYFMDVVGYFKAFTMTSTNGTWANGRPLTFDTSVMSVPIDATLFSVVCTTSLDCTAVGRLENMGGSKEAFVVSMSNGSWANAQRATFANNVQNAVPNATFTSVSCPTAGNCTAVGNFRNTANDTEAFTMTSTNGTWADAQLASFANGMQNSNQNASFKGVSCAAVDTCVAVGRFRNIGGDEEAITMTSSAYVAPAATIAPTPVPTVAPTIAPTIAPTVAPTSAPTSTTSAPTTTAISSISPTAVTAMPTGSAPRAATDGIVRTLPASGASNEVTLFILALILFTLGIITAVFNRRQRA